MFKLKHIFLALVLAMFGAMALPATAAECQTQPNGNMVCDGQEFQPVASTPSQDAAAKPAAQGITLSHEEADAIAELEEEEKRVRRHGHIMSVVSLLLGVVIVFTILSKAYNSKRGLSTNEMFAIGWVGFPLLAVSVLFYMFSPSNMSIEERVEWHQSPSNFVEKEKRMIHLRETRQKVIEREANKREDSQQPTGGEGVICHHEAWWSSC